MASSSRGASRLWALPLGLVAWAALAPPAAGLEVPYLAGRVTDLAEMVPPDVEARIEEKLARLEADLGAQVAVLTVPALEGEVLEDFSLRVAETWKLGREEFDDGALLLVARDDRKMRLEVGYGLEPTLTDALARRVLDNVMRPRFRAGDFGGGIEAAVEAVDGILRGTADPLPPPPATGSGGGLPVEAPLLMRLAMFGFFLLVVGIFSLTALATEGCGGWFLYLFLIPFWSVFPTALLGVPGVALAATWIVGAPILKLWLGSKAGKRARKSSRWGKWLASGTRGGGWSSSGGGFSGGGFSGGGGSFGGGGASSSW